MCVLLHVFWLKVRCPLRGGWARERVGERTDGLQASHLLGEVGELAAASAEVVLDLDSGGSVRRGRPGGCRGASI